MLVRPSSHLSLRSACLLSSLALVHCAGPDSGLESPASGGMSSGATGGSASGRGGSSSSLASTGGSSPGSAGGSGGDALPGASGGVSTGGTSSMIGSGGLSATGNGAAGGAGFSSTGGAGGDKSGTPACTGKPGAIRGKSNQMLTAAGVARTFVYYAPASLDANTPAPVVIVPHGWTMSGQQMYDLTQYQKVADMEGFVVMYPDGEPAALGPWNVGTGACPSSLAILPLATGDDQSFIDAMLAFVATDQCVAREHVFVAGFSMGGYFANETGCLRSDIAAVAPHSGGSHDFSACTSKHKPTIIFHGTMDGLIPVTCGKEARDRWVQHNGCGSEVESVDVMGGHCEYSKGCPADGQVALCLFDGMDHGWAGGQGNYGFPDYASATMLGWSFFRKYAW